MGHMSVNDTPRVTVFFDGACPMCVKEIALLRRLDRKRQRIAFEDVSPPDAVPSCPISQEILLARFHACKRDGQIVNGAQAFTEAWSCIPAFIWLRPLGRFPITRAGLNLLYGAFLKVRPVLVRTLFIK